MPKHHRRHNPSTRATPLSPDKLERLLYGTTIPDKHSKQRLEEARSNNMPDLRTALETAIIEAQEKVMDTNTLNAWDQDTADSRAEQGTGTGKTLFQVTSNITRELFSFVKEHPGCMFYEIKEGLAAHNANSLGSLLTQMVKQGNMRREGDHMRYRYFVTAANFTPIKSSVRKKQIRNKLVIVRKKREEPQDLDRAQTVLLTSATEPASIGLAALKVDTKTGHDVAATLDERGSRYGKFTGHASVTQALKHAALSHAKMHSTKLAPDQVEALEMICHKIGRIVNGDPNYADSWIDIAGYAKLIADRLDGLER